MDLLFHIVPVGVVLVIGYFLGLLDWMLPSSLKRHPRQVKTDKPTEWAPSEDLQRVKRKH